MFPVRRRSTRTTRWTRGGGGSAGGTLGVRLCCPVPTSARRGQGRRGHVSRETATNPDDEMDAVRRSCVLGGRRSRVPRIPGVTSPRRSYTTLRTGGGGGSAGGTLGVRLCCPVPTSARREGQLRGTWSLRCCQQRSRHGPCGRRPGGAEPTRIKGVEDFYPGPELPPRNQNGTAVASPGWMRRSCVLWGRRSRVPRIPGVTSPRRSDTT
jgi:hypothetical protein